VMASNRIGDKLRHAAIRAANRQLPHVRRSGRRMINRSLDPSSRRWKAVLYLPKSCRMPASAAALWAPNFCPRLAAREATAKRCSGSFCQSDLSVRSVECAKNITSNFRLYADCAARTRACRRTCRLARRWNDGTSTSSRIARHVDDRLVAAGVIEAIGDKVMHALLAHVGEVHRRAGRVFEVGSHARLSRSAVSPKLLKCACVLSLLRCGISILRRC
jgi:hypothetical protein